MIVFIYAVTGFVGGPLFWDRGILNVTGLAKIDAVKDNLGRFNLPVNDAFLAFACVGLLFNIAGSYSNVIAARRSRKPVDLTPLLGLTPLVAQITANVLWIRANRSFILADPRALLPFLAYWGITFAYNVGLLITPTSPRPPFPYWTSASLVGALRDRCQPAHELSADRPRDAAQGHLC